MPLGSFALINHLADHLCRHRPKSVLDVGVGFGLTGAIVRQYLDSGVQPWKTVLVGIEAFPQYKNPTWDLYGSVLEMDVREFLKDKGLAEFAKYDFIVFTDVVEHFSHEEGEEIIYKLMGMLNKGGVLWIGTPGVWAEQGAVHGNEYETHRSLWKWNEFPPGFEVIKNGEPDEFGHRMILVKYIKK